VPYREALSRVVSAYFCAQLPGIGVRFPSHGSATWNGVRLKHLERNARERIARSVGDCNLFSRHAAAGIALEISEHSYNKMFQGYQPCQLVKRRKKTHFRGPPVSSSSGY
jgi:hypothetical protein